MLDRSVARVLASEPTAAVGKAVGIPYRTLAKWVAVARAGGTRETRRTGPPPLLPEEAEDNLFEWIVARQQVGYPVQRTTIIRRASDISHLLYNREVTDGWCKRFLQRHPALTSRISQSISKARNIVREEDVEVLFDTLNALMSEKQLDANRVFNVDETAFQSRKKSKSEEAYRGEDIHYSPLLSTVLPPSLLPTSQTGTLLLRSLLPFSHLLATGRRFYFYDDGYISPSHKFYRSVEDFTPENVAALSIEPIIRVPYVGASLQDVSAQQTLLEPAQR